MKKKLLITVLSVVALLLLAGVGYATWVISQNASEEANGNIIVETVSDERLNVTVELEDPAVDSFVFGHPLDAEIPAAGKWLSAKNGDPVVNLTVNFVVTITKNGGGEFESADDVDLTLTFDTALVDAFMTEGAFDETSKTLSADSKTITAVCSATIKWGTLTNKTNPYTFFNDLGNSNDKLDTDEDGKVDDTTITLAEINSALGSSLTKDSTNADFAKAYLEYFAAHHIDTFTATVAVAYH